MNTKTILLIVGALIVLFGIYKVFFANRVPADAQLAPDDFESKMKESGVTILDVRSAFEFGGDKIKGARNISYTQGDFKGQVEKLDKSGTYLVYCLSGSRSAGAYNTMKAMGFTNVFHLRGGIDNWKSSGKPVVR
jgi:rhodanese-related sulfurtransferase